MRVLIAEDEALLRVGLRLVLDQADIEVVATVGDADELVRAAEELRPDLVLSDIRMPPHQADDGLRAALAIREVRPATAVMIISQYVQRTYAMELTQQDARGVGYLLKQRVTDVGNFLTDLRTVAAGGTVIDPEVVELMLARKRREAAAGLGSLTARQQQVLAAMAQGRSNAAIAAALAISEKAVVLHASHVYDQLGIPVSEDSHRRVLAVLRCLQG